VAMSRDRRLRSSIFSTPILAAIRNEDLPGR